MKKKHFHTYSFHWLQLEVFNLPEEIETSKGRQDVRNEGCLALVVHKLLQSLQVTSSAVKFELHQAEGWPDAKVQDISFDHSYRHQLQLPMEEEKTDNSKAPWVWCGEDVLLIKDTVSSKTLTVSTATLLKFFSTKSKRHHKTEYVYFIYHKQ